MLSGVHFICRFFIHVMRLATVSPRKADYLCYQYQVQYIVIPRNIYSPNQPLPTEHR